MATTVALGPDGRRAQPLRTTSAARRMCERGRVRALLRSRFVQTISQLLVDGDHALASRDRAELAAIARTLSRRIGDPLRAELRSLATLCLRHPPEAARRWPALRDQIALRIALAGT